MKQVLAVGRVLRDGSTEMEVAKAQRVTDLEQMIQEYEAKFPEILYKKSGSRAQSAAEIAQSGKVSFWGIVSSGSESWRADNGYEVYPSFSYCSCRDMMYVSEDGEEHKMCKHLIAVQMAKAARRQIVEWLVGLMNDSDTAGGLTLRPRVYYTYDKANRAPQENVIDEYMIHGQETVTLENDVSITLGDLNAALEQTDWYIDIRVGGDDYGHREKWVLRPIRYATHLWLNDLEKTQIFMLDGLAGDAGERRSHEMRIRGHGEDAPSIVPPEMFNDVGQVDEIYDGLPEDMKIPF